MPDARLIRRYLGVAALLALLVPTTLFLGDRPPPPISEGEASAAVAAARAEVQDRTTALLEEMRALAERVADRPLVREALIADTLDRSTASALLGAFDAQVLPPRVSVELYTRTLERRAWSGFATALTPDVRRVGFLDSLRTLAASGGVGRRALVLWLPVFDGDEPVGAVRVVRIVQEAVPVRNRYLRDYDVTDVWREEVGLPFAVAFTGPRSGLTPTAAPLRGLDGTTVGWVEVSPPSPRATAHRTRARTRAAAAFWAALFAGWVLAGLWRLHATTMRRARRLRTGPAWGLAAGSLALLVGAWIALRFSLLMFDVPARWASSVRDTAALFDPAYLGSSVGAGLLRSAGDLALTVLFAAALAVVLLRFVVQAATGGLARGWPVRVALGLVGVGLAVLTAAAYAVTVRHAVLDATLRYLDRSAPLPNAITLVVFVALLIGAAAVVLVVAAGAAVVMGREGRRRGAGLMGALAGGIVLGLAALLLPLDGEAPGLVFLPLVAAAFGLAGGALAAFLLGGPNRWTTPLSFRGLLLGVLVLAPLTYVLMHRAVRERSDVLLADAADLFEGGQDARAVYAVEQVLAEARDDDALRPALLAAVATADSARRGLPTIPLDSARQVVDTLAEGLVTGSLLASLADYTAALVLYSPEGDTLGHYADRPVPGTEASVPKTDPLGFRRLRDRYVEGGQRGFLVMRSPVERRRGVFRYAGLSPVQPGDDAPPAAWVYAEARPRLVRYVAETPFPRVLVPADPLGREAEAFSYAEYDDGVLVRSRPDVTGPFRLGAALQDSLRQAGQLWRNERVGGEPVRAFYTAVGEGEEAKPGQLDVVAVRAPRPAVYDHLFHLFRLTLAGLGAGLVMFLLGLPIRRAAGLWPPPRQRFRDRVLNRFLLVGLASVGLTGLIGQQVIAEQNEQAVRDLLRQRLERVESALIADAAPGVSTADLLARVRPEAVGAALGIDFHLYRADALVGSSRPSLVRQQLVETRLPAAVYRALVLEGEPYAFVRDRLGTFEFTTGYKAVPDAEGRPVGAVAVPTLPDQAAIEASQARIVAYLFGGLLLLLIVIFLITTLLANQLTRPFQRLRRGLQAVGAGRLDEPIPVEGHDEVGELVVTFNRMQAQLVESRRQLALQERELAWREMARQVAHEIKNPLMPMKLSVQHLRRVFHLPGEDATPEERKFAGQFERTTTTLVEQIETLSRIADEFSSFARLPRRRVEPVDLNEVVREAAALFEEEVHAEHPRAKLHLALAKRPLVVEADREELRRVYLNLLKNALQAMPEGRAGHVTVRTLPENGCALSEVVDTGAGIPETLRAKIFQPNFSTKTSGMGLGLAIVKKAVEASGGTITFETEEGKGTTFRMRFPLAAGDGAAGTA
ncbi:MAG TPA: ATP-binding protein [Rubricoccaceae bacterium]|nr:ATP-binding protein [Rubricoccaceae bacterium]